MRYTLRANSCLIITTMKFKLPKMLMASLMASMLISEAYADQTITGTVVYDSPITFDGEVVTIKGDDTISTDVSVSKCPAGQPAITVTGGGSLVVDNATISKIPCEGQMVIGHVGYPGKNGDSSASLKVYNSTVDLTDANTLIVGRSREPNTSYGYVEVKDSTFISASNSLWVYNGTIDVKNSYFGASTHADDCKGTYGAYRLLLGLYGGTATVNVTEGSTFESGASRLVLNYGDVETGYETNVYLNVDGEGSSFTQFEKIPTDNTTETITYICDPGTDNKNVKSGYSDNSYAYISATNKGVIDIQSNQTYIGSSEDQALQKTKKLASFTIGEDSSISFRKMDIYANTNIDNSGTFRATDINVHDGAVVKHIGGGDATVSSLNVAGVLHIGSADTTEKTNLTIDVAPSSSKSAYVTGENGGTGELYITNANVKVTEQLTTEKKSPSSQFRIGNGGKGSMTVDGKSTVDLSVGTTLALGMSDGYGELTVKGGSTLTGGFNNFWMGNAVVNVQGKDTTAYFCSTETGRNNYRTLLGVGGGTSEIYVSDHASVVLSGSQFVSSYDNGAIVNIVVEGEGSTFTQTATTRTSGSYHVGSSGNWVERKKGVDGWIRPDGWYDEDSTGDVFDADKYENTITYLCDAGTDERGRKTDAYAINHCTTNISAKDGGSVKFDSTLTYIGSFLDKKLNYTDKSANFSIGEASSISFNRMKIYAETNIENAGTFTATDVELFDGATLNYAASRNAELNLSSMVVKDGASLNFSALQDATTFSMRDAAIPAITVSGDFVLEAGATLTLDGVYVDGLESIANSLTIEDGAIINVTGLDDLDGDGMVTLFTNFTMVNDTTEGTVSVVLNGVETQLNISEGSVTVSSASIPEPTTATLSLLALAALTARRRRR